MDVDDVLRNDRKRIAGLIERNKVLGTALQDIIKLCEKYALTDSFDITTIAQKALRSKNESK